MFCVLLKSAVLSLGSAVVWHECDVHWVEKKQNVVFEMGNGFGSKRVTERNCTMMVFFVLPHPLLSDGVVACTHNHKRAWFSAVERSVFL